MFSRSFPFHEKRERKEYEFELVQWNQQGLQFNQTSPNKIAGNANACVSIPDTLKIEKMRIFEIYWIHKI